MKKSLRTVFASLLALCFMFAFAASAGAVEAANAWVSSFDNGDFDEHIYAVQQDEQLNLLWVDSIVSGGKYYLKNPQTGRYIDIDDNATVPYSGDVLEQWDFSGLDTQVWEFIDVGNGYYKIKSTLRDGTTELYLSVKNNSTDNDADVILLPYNGQYGQQWKLELTNRDFYKIIPRCAESYNRVLCVNNAIFGSTQNGLNLKSRTYSNDSNYKDEWHFYTASLYGSRIYKSVNSDKINCHGYAMDIGIWPELLSTSDGNYVYNSNYSLSQIAERTKKAFETWLKSNDYTYYQAKGTYIGVNQYRVVLRVGRTVLPFQINGQTYYTELFYDYHFWYQTNDGRWANKHGGMPSELLNYGITPESSNTSGWQLEYSDIDGNSYTYHNFYNSQIYYYIIGGNT